VSPADRNCVGSRNCGLGVDLTVGEQVYDLSGALNVTIGPTDWAAYLSFLPGERCHSETRALVKLYCADPMSFTVELCLNAGEAPELRVSSDSAASRLGFTSWVRTEEVPQTSVTFGPSSSDLMVSSAEAPGERESVGVGGVSD
jgi:predicted component of type VI protein secretion system